MDIHEYLEPIIVGDDFQIPVVFEVNISGTWTPVDITGYEIHFLLMADLESTSTAVISDIVTTHTNPTAGQTLGLFEDTDTVGLTPGSYFLVIKWIDTLSLKKTKVIASILVEESGETI